MGARLIIWRARLLLRGPEVAGSNPAPGTNNPSKNEKLKTNEFRADNFLLMQIVGKEALGKMKKILLAILLNNVPLFAIYMY